MPYEIKQVGNGYLVINTKTKKQYSKKPIPKKNATKQLAILKRFEKLESKTLI